MAWPPTARAAIAAAGCGLALAGDAWAQGGAQAPGFPADLTPPGLTAWLKRETDIAPAAVVEVTPDAVAGVLGSISVAEGPTRRQVILRSEALSARGAQARGGLSWTSVYVVDCKTRRFRAGRTVAYPTRNLIGEGREIRPAATAWAAPSPNGAVDVAMRRVCDGATVGPLLASAVARSPGRPAPGLAAAEPQPLRPKISPSPSPAPKPAPAKAPPVTPTPPARGGAILQVAAAASEAEARQALAQARGRMGDSLPAGVSGRVVKAVVRGKTYHRAQFTGFAPDAAVQACSALAAQGQACFVRASGKD